MSWIARGGWAGSMAWLILGLPLSVHGQAPRAVADEVREYDVQMGGNPIGTTVIRITDLSDDTTVVSTEAQVKVNLLIRTYAYEFHGSETWQAGRLLRVDDRATDDGQQLAVRASNDSRGSLIEVPGKPAQQGPAVTMTTNYWWLPIGSAVGEKWTIMEGDSGVLQTARLEHVGLEAVSFGGQQIPCNHYRLSGTLAADLWLDGQNRLVRRITSEDGHLIEARLSQLRKLAPAAGK